MSEFDEVHKPGVFLCRRPVKDACPLIFDIPRSGREYPNWFRSPAAFNDVRRNVSMYVEALYEDVPEEGATWLFACFPNTLIDANRNEKDVDAALIAGASEGQFSPSDRSLRGVGLIPKFCGDGSVPLQGAPMSMDDLERRLNDFYWPYHNELSANIARLKNEFGRVYHISCHSMAGRGNKAMKDAGQARSDFDIGDGNGKTCGPDFVEAVKECLSDFGYDVTVNRHFAGAECIHKHASVENGIESLQIEVNRSLYMVEETFEKKPAFDRVKSHLGALARELAQFANDKV